MKPPHVHMVEVVTREHAATFAEVWRERVEANEMSDAMNEAFSAVALMTWPGDDDRAAQERHDAIEREIVETTCTLAKSAIAEAFYMAATVILARERSR